MPRPFLSLATTLLALFVSSGALGQESKQSADARPASLSYAIVPNFFALPAGVNFVEPSAVAVNSQGHVFVLHRAQPYLLEFDEQGKFIGHLADSVFSKPHGLRIDKDDNIWTTDTGNNMVLKLNPAGRVLLALGCRNLAANGEWVFNQPTDVAVGPNGDIFVADGYGNARIVKFDRDGNFIKSWGRYGTAPGEFNLPHSIVIDSEGIVYVADRENKRVQLFTTDGQYLKSWNDVGYPYALVFDNRENLWLADGGYDRVLKLDRNGKILGAFGAPGRAPGQLAWAHWIAAAKDDKLFVAEILDWRVQVFSPKATNSNDPVYHPNHRMFIESQPSDGWLNRHQQ